MSDGTYLALDVALLLPPEISSRAIDSSTSLPTAESQGLQLGDTTLPHITLTQQFVSSHDLESAFARLDMVLRRQPALQVTVTSGGRGGSGAVWMTIERSNALVGLHASLMDALAELEKGDGGPDAFLSGDGRSEDVTWVTGFRSNSSFGRFTPHITLGHASEAPAIETFSFEATTAAACHLGRFCTCCRVLRRWTLERSA